MIFTVHSEGWIEIGDRRAPCALGRSGVIAAEAKREGDGATPAGLWPLREAFYRPDRGPPPKTRLPLRALRPRDGWCDAPADPAYNRAVVLPYPASAERLWRGDALYDLLVVLGYNDAPAAPGAGSAIFLHLAQPAYRATEGCVALSPDDLVRILALARPGDALDIRPCASAARGP